MASKRSLDIALWSILVLTIGMSIALQLIEKGDVNANEIATVNVVIIIAFGLYLAVNKLQFDQKRPAPDDWVLEKISDEFKTYEEAVDYFTKNCRCSINFVCVTEEIGRFITNADGAGLQNGMDRLKELIRQKHPTNEDDPVNKIE